MSRPTLRFLSHVKYCPPPDWSSGLGVADGPRQQYIASSWAVSFRVSELAAAVLVGSDILTLEH